VGFLRGRRTQEEQDKKGEGREDKMEEKQRT